MFTCRVVGEVLTPEVPPHVVIGIAIIDVATNQTMSRIAFKDLRVHPVRTGTFVINFRLQANLPAGLYRFDTGMWHEQEDLLIQGPNRIFQVKPTSDFFGTHQLNAVAEFVP